MSIDNDDLKFNFGCSSCGYKQIPPGAPLGRIPVSRMIERLDAFFAKNDMESAGRLLSDWQLEAIALHDLSGELSVVNEMLGYYRKTGEKEKALSAVDRSLELLSLLNEENTVSGATVLLNAATTMKAFGRAKDALPLYDRTFSIYNENLEESDARLGGFYNNKALTLVDLKKYEEAENCYFKALSIMENIEGKQPDCAVTYINMAHLYNDYMGPGNEKTDSCLNTAIYILNGQECKRDSYYAFVCNKCAPSLDYFGFFADARELKERAKKIYEGA